MKPLVLAEVAFRVPGRSSSVRAQSTSCAPATAGASTVAPATRQAATSRLLTDEVIRTLQIVR